MSRRPGPRRLIFGEDRMPKVNAETAEAWPPIPAEQQWRQRCHGADGVACDWVRTGSQEQLSHWASRHGAQKKHALGYPIPVAQDFTP